jgi:polyhydroxyalkanoate synthase
LKGATEHKGSWWPEWKKWLSRFSGGKVPARVPGDGALKTLEDAPGSYVANRVVD